MEGFAIDGSGEVIFPEAIRFTIVLSRPVSEIEAISLTIDTQNRAPFTPTFELEEIIQNAEPEAFLAYTWVLPENEIPPLFSNVTFAWDVEATDGVTAHVEGVVEFTDQRVVWINHEPIPDRLIIQASRDVPSRLIQNVRTFYELLSANTEQTPEIRLMLYDSAVAPGCIIQRLADGTEDIIARGPYTGASVFCRPGFEELVYSDYAVFQRAPGSEVETAIADYMADKFYQTLWNGNEVPAWFESGLRTFYTPELKTELLPIVQTLARNNRLFSLDAMNSDPPDDPQRRNEWQAQSYGMVLYIAELVGVQGLFEMAAALGDSESFSEVYSEMTGEALQALIPAWEGWIFTDRAELVYGITPYQPPTATYTATHTATSTPLPTETLTPSQTLTPSVTGTLSSTPPPTVTPSRTRTPEPPTVTPRPPQRTPTPAPLNPVNALSNPNVQAGVIIVLLIIIGILMYAYIRLGRR